MNLSFDVNKIREDFPILSKKIHNKPLVYFDNAATSQTPVCVIECIKAVSYTHLTLPTNPEV